MSARLSTHHVRRALQFYVDDHASACHDDLIFFVKQPAEPGAACSQFTVHRKGRAVPADLSISGQAFSTVAWPETVLLNLVLQARYQLTVTACRCDLAPARATLVSARAPLAQMGSCVAPRGARARTGRSC